jgi:hypothetical protein
MISELLKFLPQRSQRHFKSFAYPLRTLRLNFIFLRRAPRVCSKSVHRTCSGKPGPQGAPDCLQKVPADMVGELLLDLLQPGFLPALLDDFLVEIFVGRQNELEVKPLCLTKGIGFELLQ